MSVLTDLLLARPEEAAAIVAEWPPEGRSRWPDIEMKGQSEVTLGQLLAIIRDVEWTPEIFLDEQLASGGPEGDASEVNESLTLLRAFCRRARAEGASMLMWTSL